MKLCSNYQCNKIVSDYVGLCMKCKPKKEKENIKKIIINKIPKVYKIHKLSYKEKYGLVKTEMPKQVTLKRDNMRNII